MKFKVVKEFNSLKKGDILTNSEETPDIFVFEEESDNKYRYISYNDVILYELEDQGYVIVLADEEDKSDEEMNTICKAIDEIDNLLEQYEQDNETVTEKFANNEIPFCAKVEADTVHYNLTKVLTKIKSILTGENE